MSRRRTESRQLACVLLLALLVWAAPAGAADDAWSDSDVEAAERYREQERERAERYRARVETAESEAPARREAPRARAEKSSAPLGERIGARVRAWLEGALAEVVRAVADALRAALAELLGGFEQDPASPRRDFAQRGGAGDWLRREQARAEDWLDGRPGRAAPAPAPESVREWQRREAERALALKQREAEAALERARRSAELARDEWDRARWQERWHDADAWEAEERERAARQREAAAEWQAEERARFESGARD